MMKKQTNENNFTKRNINEYKFEGKTYDRMFRMFLWFYLLCDFSVVCILFFLNVSFYLFILFCIKLIEL